MDEMAGSEIASQFTVDDDTAGVRVWRRCNYENDRAPVAKDGGMVMLTGFSSGVSRIPATRAWSKSSRYLSCLVRVLSLLARKELQSAKGEVGVPPTRPRAQYRRRASSLCR